MWWEDDSCMVDVLVNRGYEVVYPEETEIIEALQILYDLQPKGLLKKAVDILKQIKEEDVAHGSGR